MESVISTLTDTPADCVAPLSFSAVIGIVAASCVLGLLWSLFNVILVNKIDVEKGNDG